MGCAGSKRTKIVKFQEPGSPPQQSEKTANQTTATPPGNNNDESATQPTKVEDNSLQQNKNNNKANEQPQLIPIIELPKTTVEHGEPAPQKSLNAKESATNEQDSAKDNSKDATMPATDRRPMSGGVWETRSTVIDATTSRIYSPTRMASSAFASKTLTILHFNDVYNIEPRDQEPVGGAARFVTKIKSFSEVNGGAEPMVLFSGDLLNPSLSKLCIFSAMW